MKHSSDTELYSGVMTHAMLFYLPVSDNTRVNLLLVFFFLLKVLFRHDEFMHIWRADWLTDNLQYESK